MLEATVLVLQLLQLLRVAHLHAAELRFPAQQCLLADRMLPANFRRLHPSPGLLQDCDDLFFTVALPTHSPLSFLESLHRFWTEMPGAGHWHMIGGESCTLR